VCECLLITVHEKRIQHLVWVHSGFPNTLYLQENK
jgi:hypothetical protein